MHVHLGKMASNIGGWLCSIKILKNIKSIERNENQMQSHEQELPKKTKALEKL